MRIGVISDTHGSRPAIGRAVAAAGKVDMWLHAGDYSQDAAFLAELTGLPVTAVAGNCDGQTAAKVDEFISAGGKKLWLTHGHNCRAGERTAELAWWGRKYGVDAVIYGHSHIPDITLADGLLIFNPGSPWKPRGNHAPSCGILKIDGGEITAEIIAL